ncbi:ABC transporter permease [Actibacterium sp. MT2.3-13A]|uniref:ABC transporter permease n=1 Tax=Actibacterium sp. MT2.3-13A TaxID=2828332 RepID=UPI001BA68379
MLREMSTRYGRTPGGYIWAVLEPLAAIVILAIGFSLLLRTPSLGTSFILFYASGYLPFNLYHNISLMVSGSLKFSKPLLAYPSVTWIDAILARFLLNLLTASMVAYILLTAILLLTDTRTVLDVRPMIEAMALAALLGLGIGTMNCVLSGLYPTWIMVWSIATRPLFLMSGVIYIYEDLPQMAQDILWYNPLLHITGLMRTGLYPMYNPEYVSVPFVVYTALILLTLGLILLRRYYREILNA